MVAVLFGNQDLGGCRKGVRDEINQARTAQCDVTFNVSFTDYRLVGSC